MPLAVLAKIIGKAIEETAVDAVTVPHKTRPRSHKNKKSVKAKSSRKNWMIVLAIAILLVLLLSHGRIGR